MLYEVITYAVCLEGPPGAGKTKYAEVYTKLISDLHNDNVEMLSYQCDPTTGKSELFEEINITAVVSGDTNKINIPGKIIKAINEVNSGKKVILFIDEYDKSREETDAFLLQFLQSGNRITSYNVCYTKLLRLISHLFKPVMNWSHLK